MGQNTLESENRIIVVGVGLIGGSVAAAIRKRQPDCEVIGIGRCEARLKAATEAGLLTSWSTQYSEDLLADRCCVVVCLPVQLIGREVCRIAELAGEEVLITDAGSVKAIICAEVEQHSCANRRFVGAHPIAGGEQGGFEHADADLFQNRVCVITGRGSSQAALQQTDRARQFWRQLGCRIVDMTADDHDRVLALTSHLPHLIAAVTTAVVGGENFSLAGSGFRDATRIAAGDAALWTAIMAGNREPLIQAVCSAERQLAEYRTALETQDDTQLMALLSRAAELRRQLEN